MNLNGIINVYKEKGYTSFDVVACLRKILGMKKIGHTGTLDPDATGVLPICLGKATKVSDMLTDNHKVYKAKFKLGFSTDTQDISGNVTQTCDDDTLLMSVQLEQVQTVLNSFIGEYEQVPPMYSAIRHNGKHLYELAREGIIVERKPRKVTVFDIMTVGQIDEKTFSFQVCCSKGTYIRTLIYDVGIKLGTYATMTELERTEVEPFSAKEGLTLEQIRKLKEENTIEDYILPIDRLFDKYVKVKVPESLEKALYNGNKLPYDLLVSANIAGTMTETTQRLRVYDSHNVFIGIYKIIEDNELKILKVDKMFI